MYQVKCLNKISPLGTSRLGENYHVGEDVENPDAILVRSAAMHDMEFNKNLLAIARAGAGTNNIPVERCVQEGIVVFNTPGANANAVKELVIAALLLTSRKIVPGIEWAGTLKGKGDEVGKLVEKGKSSFGRLHEIAGKTLGVVGLGAIGILVANAAEALGMKVMGYDPFLSVEGAWGLSSNTQRALTLEEIYANCDYISLHVPLTPDTKEMINAATIAQMKEHVRILNFARGDLVNNTDLLKALSDGKVAAYATDFPNDALLGVENVLAIPHLGASTPESEDNCACMAADEIKDYLENGNIKNSVNLPNVSMPRENGAKRVCIIHQNIPNMISTLTGVLANIGVNIENMQSKSKKEYAYTILDVTGNVNDDTVKAINDNDGIIFVRVI